MGSAVAAGHRAEATGAQHGADRLAEGRALIVHEAGGTRAQMTDLLAREGFSVEAVESTFRAIARFVDDPAQLVILGLGGIRENELEFIRTLKREPQPPSIVVAFPASLRDLAVRALEAGADAYLLEPFYAAEFQRIAIAHLRAAGAGAATGGEIDLARLAAEVAHAINNPLQILSLVLDDEKVPKKQLAERVTAELDRIRAVVRHLSAFDAAAPLAPGAHDARALLEQAAAEEAMAERLSIGPGARVDVRADERNLLAALRALLGAVRARAGADEVFRATVAREHGTARIAIEASAAIFRGERPGDLASSVFVVRDDRQVVPGLALARALLTPQQGALDVETDRERVTLVIRLPAA